ncbi:WD40-repeat-containing domain protein [Hygrophoropsis aurantiaca]|uniref:WD40-repeat-containing domain protein n=1 Tax=Hygrophoropsis aurantiaca TaxID=72124 RepID=A0ACB8ACG9_9AGAM|nr:WD40-repeat-containing domain protein [Hygrophoropsis aurantiaca]
MNGRVQVFDVAIGGTVVGPFKTHADTVASLVFTHDGQQIITASWDKAIRVWNGASGREVGEPMLGHEESISQIALSNNGLCIASASSDHTVRIWDVSTRRQIGDLLRAQDPVGSVAWSLSSLSIIAGDFDGNIHLWTVPPLDDNITAQAPVLNANTPPLPVGSTRALRSRTNSISSSVLNLSAGPLPTPPRPTELDNVTAEENDWEFSTNESFDSVLDLPADGTRPAQRRKRRRRRAAAPVASTSSLPVPTNHQMSPAIISAPRHSPPLANKTTSPPTQTTPDTHAVAGAPAPRIGALRRLWRQRRTLPRWTRRKPHKNRNATRKSQPIAPSPVPNAPADDIETQSIEVATDHAEAYDTRRRQNHASYHVSSRDPGANPYIPPPKASRCTPLRVHIVSLGMHHHAPSRGVNPSRRL